MKWKLPPQLQQEIAASAAKVFGTLPVVNHRTGTKLLKPKPIGPMIVNHYQPFNTTRQFKKIVPTFETQLQVRRLDLLERLRRRGKPTPKKGQGKRAQKGGAKK